MKSDSKRLDTWLLERYLARDLSAKERRRLEKRLESEPQLRQELERLERSNREILGLYPAGRLVPEILERAAKESESRAPKPKRIRPLSMALPALAAALLLVILLPLVQRQSGRDSASDSGNRVKGDLAPRLQVFRQQGDAAEKLENGASARTGDLLQLSYSPGKAVYGVILSIDGRGGVTLHHPQNAADAPLLQRGGKILLPNSYRLDDAPRFERFIFVTAQTTLSVTSLLEKAKTLASDPRRAQDAPLDIQSQAAQFSLVILKRQSP